MLNSDEEEGKENVKVVQLFGISALNFAITYAEFSFTRYLSDIFTRLVGTTEGPLYFSLFTIISFFPATLALLSGYLSDRNLFSKQNEKLTRYGPRAPYFILGTSLFAASLIITTALYSTFHIFFPEDGISSTSAIILVIFLGIFSIVARTGVGLSTATYIAFISDTVKREQLGFSFGVFLFASLIGHLVADAFSILFLRNYHFLFYFFFPVFAAVLLVVGVISTLLSAPNVVKKNNTLSSGSGSGEGMHESGYFFGDDTQVYTGETIPQKISIAINGWRGSGFHWAILSQMIFLFGIIMIQFSIFGAVFQMSQPYNILIFNLIDANYAAMLLVTETIILATLSAIPSGYLADRYGTRSISIYSGLSVSGLSLLCGFIILFDLPFYLLLFVNIFAGISIGCFLAVDQALIIKSIPYPDRFGTDISIQILLSLIIGGIARFTSSYLPFFFTTFLSFSFLLAYSLTFIIGAILIGIGALIIFPVPKSVDSSSLLSFESYLL